MYEIIAIEDGIPYITRFFKNVEKKIVIIPKVEDNKKR